MLNPTVILADSLGAYLEESYRRMFGSREPDYPVLLNRAGRLVLELIGNSDAVYHDLQHTMLVTLVGQDILRGRHFTEQIEPDDWLHFTLALLGHDIGYVRGVCADDRPGSYVTDDAGGRITPPRGASDAFLGPYHIERGKIYAHERCGPIDYLDAERIASAIEMTRFPVPDKEEYRVTDTEPALVRAADLIGQLGDPNYLRKHTNLFHEFSESGMNEKLGYDNAADLSDEWPRFFWEQVQPYIAPACDYLSLTQVGKQWVANMHSHVFALENNLYRFGPHR